MMQQHRSQTDVTYQQTRNDRPAAGATAGRLKALVEKMVSELRRFDDDGDNALWALAQGTADDLEITLYEIDCHTRPH